MYLIFIHVTRYNHRHDCIMQRVLALVQFVQRRLRTSHEILEKEKKIHELPLHNSIADEFSRRTYHVRRERVNGRFFSRTAEQLNILKDGPVREAAQRVKKISSDRDALIAKAGKDGVEAGKR